MKAEFLKIAGVKSEKAFYKKYPTEAAFFKAHPEAKKSIKKAQAGINIDSNRNGIPDYLENMNPNIGNIIQSQMQSPGVNASMFSVGNQQPINNTKFAPGSYNSWDIDNNGVPDTIQKPEGNPLVNQLEQPQGQQPSNANAMMQGGINIIGGLASGISQRREQKRLLEKELLPWDRALDVVKKAKISNMFAEKPKRTWIRPDDPNQIFNINQMYPGQGVGTNILSSAKNGARLQDGGMIGGNPTEIQNTYNDGTDIYTDLEYEPLYDVNQVKSYEYGGEVPSAQWGVFSEGNQGFGQNTYGAVTSSLFPNSGGSQIGSSIGSVAGPYGGLIGGMLGGMFDALPGKVASAEKRIQKDIDYIAGIDNTQGVHNWLGGIGVAKNGANVNPQIISQFGGNNLMSLLAPPKNVDMLRSGGHLKESYVEPTQRALSTYGLGGQLKTTWGGGIETISKNPYDESETVLFRGQSHDNGGIGVKYGEEPRIQDYAEYGTSAADADVEVQGNEPAKIMNGDLIVAGGIKTSKEAAEFAGNPKLAGKKYQTNIKEIAKKDAKIISKRDKLINDLDQHNDDTPFGTLRKKGIEMMLNGLESQLATNSDQSRKLLIYQNEITNEGDRLSELYGKKVDPNFLEKGEIKFEKESGKAKNGKTMKLKEAMFGTKIKKAQDGEDIPDDAYGLTVWEGNKYGNLGKRTASDFTLKQWNQIAKKYGFKGKGNKEFQKFLMSHPETAKIIKARHNMLYGRNPETDENMYDSKLGRGYAAAELLDLPPAATVPADTKPKGDQTKKEDAKFEIIPANKNIGLNILGQLLPYIRQPYREGIDPSQFAPEINAIIQNKEEPVPMQQVTPFLDDVIDISYQDILNENDSDFLTALRSTDNPAMKANLLAQKYGANAKVLGEKFRDNQLSRNAVFSGNRAKLFDAQVRNIAAAADQAYKQDVARSKTRETNLEAFKSIANKRLMHQRDLRTYNVYQTGMFPQFGFDRSGRTIFQGGYNQFNIPYVYGANGKATHKIIKDGNGNIIGYEPITQEESAVIPPNNASPIVDQTASEMYSPVDYTPIDDEEYTNEEYMNQVAPKKLGGKVKKNYLQSSIVRSFK